MARVLVTGASGFVGRTLCHELLCCNYVVRAALRQAGTAPPGTEGTVVGEIGRATDWAAALRDVDLVIHAAARVHCKQDAAASASLYMETNARGTQHLAEVAADVGVRRLIYLSSVKVNGEEVNGHAYRPSDEPRPVDGYGTSKWQGELALREIAARTGLQAAVVRAPLVYGPGVRANFLQLLKWVDRGWALPLGAVRNRRSLVNVWNLCDLLIRLLRHSDVSHPPWMVSDGEDLSTPELIRRIGKALGKPARLLTVPEAVLRSVGSVTGTRAQIARLCGSLALDIGQTCEELQWSPPVGVDEGLRRTAAWYRTACSGHA